MRKLWMSESVLLHEVVGRHCRRLERVGRGTPAEAVVGNAGFRDGKAARSKRLHHKFAAVAVSDEFEHTFVDGTRHGKSEFWIKAVFHVGEILMRQQLEQHGRHFRHTCFEIALVPHAAAGPVRFELRTHVVGYIAQHEVCEVARSHSRGTVAEHVAGRAVYAERTYYAVVECGSGICVESETQIHGHAETLAFRQHRRTACKPVHPQAAAAVVVGVVIDIATGSVYAVGSACPLEEIACALREARIA